MKLLKRVRGFLRSRIPFLRKKKKDVAAQINEGFQDDAPDDGIAEERGEFAQDSKSGELDGPVPPEMFNEALKSDNEQKSSTEKFNNEEKSLESVPFPSEILDMMPHGQFPPENIKEELTAAIAVTTNTFGLDEGDKVKYKADAPFSAEKCMTLHGPSSQESSDETLEYRLSYSIKDELLGEGQSEEKFDCFYDDDEMAIVNCQISREKIEACDGLADQNDSSKFEVDFEGAFGPNMKEFNTDDPWYHVSPKTIENVGHSSEYHRFGLERDNEFGDEFDAVIEQYAKRHKIDSYDDAFGCNIENPYNESHFIEKNPIDYDFAYDDDSEEEIVKKKTKKKKLKVVIRDRPVKNVTLQKLFLYSDVDNQMYIREIKDPLKRKDVVRSDLSGFKHVPVWDSTNMKKYYSDGDLGRPPPDFSMTFTNVKE